MTEAEWLAATDPTLMPAFVRRTASDRKLRLFACGRCRLIWPHLPDDRCQAAVRVGEQYADGLANDDDLQAAHDAAMLSVEDAVADQDFERAVWAADARDCAHQWTNRVVRLTRNFTVYQPREDCQLLTDLFGPLPFRPIVAETGWLTSTVRGLAEGIYAERAFDRMPILADALEDAGCDGADILAHCRGDGLHVRGCWVVDLILGKE